MLFLLRRSSIQRKAAKKLVVLKLEKTGKGDHRQVRVRVDWEKKSSQISFCKNSEGRTYLQVYFKVCTVYFKVIVVTPLCWVLPSDRYNLPSDPH